jgi:ribosome-associated heat shock protein Hsp15
MQQDRCRIDVWLWRARFLKSRTLAARLIDDGGVRLIRSEDAVRIDKASRTLTIGDQLMFARSGRLVSLEVLALAERRGSARDAQSLYRLLGEPAQDGCASSAPNSR